MLKLAFHIVVPPVAFILRRSAGLVLPAAILSVMAFIALAPNPHVSDWNSYIKGGVVPFFGNGRAPVQK